MTNAPTPAITEIDYLAELLQGTGAATKEQQAIIDHPGKNSQSTVVRIEGPAGTGKTFCLLAKLLKEARNRSDQADPLGQRPLLFVCFNREMINYVRHLLRPFPESKLIHVTTFDSLVHYLTLPAPDGKRKTWAADVSLPRGEGWRIDYTLQPTLAAMEHVAPKHPELAKAYFFDTEAAESVHWVNDELCWLEARYESTEDARRLYPDAVREGRGSSRRPGTQARAIILELWEAQRAYLESARRFTLEQAVKRLMGSKRLPRFAMIAIDEAQDLSTRSIQLLLKMRRSDQSRVYLAVDDGQKIYQRDFSWKKLADADRGIEPLKGTTYRLHENKRNSAAVQAFADRLRGGDGSPDAWEGAVKAVHGGEADVLALAADLARRPGQTTMLVGGASWDKKLREAGVVPRNPLKEDDGKNREEVDITEPGLYVMGELKGKGLEFDNVIVPSLSRFAEDEESERRLRYVHFSRARRKLYIFADDDAPFWFHRLYPEAL